MKPFFYLFITLRLRSCLCWNGTLLNSVSTVIEWTKTMTWNAMTPVVNLIDKVYSKGVKLTKSEKEDVEDKIIRNGELPKWDLLIIPEGMVNS